MNISPKYVTQQILFKIDAKSTLLIILQELICSDLNYSTFYLQETIINGILNINKFLPAL